MGEFLKFSTVEIILLAILFVFVLVFFSIRRTRIIKEKTSRTEKILKQIVNKDASWNEEDLKNNAKNTFYRIMNGLAYKDYEDLKKVIHPKLFSRWEKQFSDFENCNPENLNNNQVENVTIVDIDNYIDDEKDTYTVRIEFMASEYTIDGKGNLIVDNYNVEDEHLATGLFTEYWKFEREGNEWLVIEVNRNNKWKKYVNDELINEEK